MGNYLITTLILSTFKHRLLFLPTVLTFLNVHFDVYPCFVAADHKPTNSCAFLNSNTVVSFVGDKENVHHPFLA